MDGCRSVNSLLIHCDKNKLNFGLSQNTKMHLIKIYQSIKVSYQNQNAKLQKFTSNYKDKSRDKYRKKFYSRIN